MHRILASVVGTCLAVCLCNAAANAQAAPDSGLTARQQSIVAIAAFTANGNLKKLDPALRAGLERGLTVNEIKEMLVQLYAYTGFPRSLNGIHTFMAVMQEREAKGIRDVVGKEPGPLPADLDRDAYGAKVRAQLGGQQSIPAPAGYQLFAPAIDSFLKQHLFADIFARNNLDWQSRELTTISALAAMAGTAGQLRAHLRFALNTGLTEAQLADFIRVIRTQVGKPEAKVAQKVLAEVLKARSGK